MDKFGSLLKPLPGLFELQSSSHFCSSFFSEDNFLLPKRYSFLMRSRGIMDCPIYVGLYTFLLGCPSCIDLMEWQMLCIRCESYNRLPHCSMVGTVF